MSIAGQSEDTPRSGAGRLFAGAAVLAAALSLAAPAAAQVLEIAPDGQVTTISGPAVYLGDGKPPQPIIAGIAKGRVRSPRSRAPAPEIQTAIAAASARYAVSSALATAVAWRESGFDNAALSPKGARGVMQLMPDTARTLKVDPLIASDNIDGGVAYLGSLLRRYDGDVMLALAAYNAGPGAVDRYRGVPPYRETHAYIDAIFNRLSAISTGPASQSDIP